MGGSGSQRGGTNFLHTMQSTLLVEAARQGRSLGLFLLDLNGSGTPNQRAGGSGEGRDGRGGRRGLGGVQFGDVC